MLAWEMSMEPVQLRRAFDADDEYEDDGYQLPDDDDDEDLEDDDEDFEEDEDEEDEYDEYEEEFEDDEAVPKRRGRRSDWEA